MPRLAAERNTELRAAIQARAEEVYAQLLLDHDNLNALETRLAREAATNLALAHFSLNTDMRARLLSSSGRILDKLQKAVAARAEAAPVEGFDL